MVDGPSLGGFVCPATITTTELWKMGQVRPGDSVRFRKLTVGEVRAAADGAGKEAALLSSACAWVLCQRLGHRPSVAAESPCSTCLRPNSRRISLPGLQAYTQRLQVDHQVSLVNQVARGALSAEAAVADMAAYKVGRSPGGCGLQRACSPAWPWAHVAATTRLAAGRSWPQPGCGAGPAHPQGAPSMVARSPSLSLQVEVPEVPPTEAVLRVVPAVEGRHPGAQVRRTSHPVRACRAPRRRSSHGRRPSLAGLTAVASLLARPFSAGAPRWRPLRVPGVRPHGAGHQPARAVSREQQPNLAAQHAPKRMPGTGTP